MEAVGIQVGDVGLSQFRAALCKRDSEVFDRLMEKAGFYSTAIYNSTLLKPHEARILSILLEQEKRLEDLDRQISQGT
jgi:hypothetical protein